MPLILGLAAAFVVLLFIAAGLTATLSAVLKVTDSKARILVGEGFAGADALTALRSGEAATSPLVILRAICNLAAAAAGVGAAAAAWGPRGMWIGGPVVIIVVLLAGELGPRALAARRPVRLALAAAPFLRSSSRLFSPRVLSAACAGTAFFACIRDGREFAGRDAGPGGAGDRGRGGDRRLGRAPPDRACLPARRAERVGRDDAPGGYCRMAGVAPPGRHPAGAGGGATLTRPRSTARASTT